jgi:hypothetical protein
VSVQVELTPGELRAAVVIGAERKLFGDRRRLDGRASAREEHYVEPVTWDQEIEAAAAELAVCRWRGRYWLAATNGGKVAGDSGGFQVRWTAHELGHLIVYPEDDRDDPFVLVVGRTPRLYVVGWIYAEHARQERYWRDRGVKCPSWWVPQSALEQAR